MVRVADPGVGSGVAGRGVGRVEDALQMEEMPLPLESAGIPAEPAAGVKNAVAWHDDGDRVRAERVAGRPIRVRRPRGRGDLAVARDAPERDARRCAEDIPGEPPDEAPVDRHVERATVALEVLVELAADRIGPFRRLENAR